MHRVALKPIGSAGVVPWQGIADALLISNFFLNHITEADILPERSRQVQVSLLSSQVATQLNHLFLNSKWKFVRIQKLSKFFLEQKGS